MNKVQEHKEYFAHSKINRYHIGLFLLLLTAFYIGFKVERKHWTSKIIQQIIDVGTLVFLNYFKKRLWSLIAG